MLSPTMQYLEYVFPGQALIPVIKAGQCLSFAPQTTRNKLYDGVFPIPTFKKGGEGLF